MATLIIICGALLIVFALYSTVQKARGKSKSSCCGTPEVKTIVKVEDTDESHYPYRYMLSIEGMECVNCARRVENLLNSMKGVWSTVDLGRARASVLTKEERDSDDFAKVLSGTGYTLKGFSPAER